MRQIAALESNSFGNILVITIFLSNSGVKPVENSAAEITHAVI
jgi:hypothetical protein